MALGLGTVAWAGERWPIGRERGGGVYSSSRLGCGERGAADWSPERSWATRWPVTAFGGH